MALAYRAALDRDLKFVLYNWVASQKYEPTAGLIPADDWREVMTPVFERILKRPGVKIFVAYDPDETDYTADLFGYIATETGHREPLVHYIFVKKNFRGEGMARGLFQIAGIDLSRQFFYSCQTRLVAQAELQTEGGPAPRIPLLRRFWQATFVPVLCRHPKDQTKKGYKDHGQDSKKAQLPRG